MVAYKRNDPIVIRTLVLFKELHLLSEQLEQCISSHLSIACWFSLHKGGHLFHAFGAFPPEQTQFSAQSLQSPHTDNYAVCLCAKRERYSLLLKPILRRTLTSSSTQSTFICIYCPFSKPLYFDSISKVHGQKHSFIVPAFFLELQNKKNN